VNVTRLAAIITSLGVKTSVVGNKVRCNCLLSPWTHPGGRDDSPSMVVFAEGRYGDPIYSCLACHERGSVRDLLCLLWSKTGRNMMPHIEAIDGESAPLPEGIAKPEVHRTRMKYKETLKDGYEGARQRRLRDPDGGPWFDHLAIEMAEKVPEIPWKEYEPYTGGVPIYASRRGLLPETCWEWELGNDRARRRLLFPMRDRKGRLVAISGRLYEEKNCLRCGGAIIEKQFEGKKKPVKVCALCGRKPPPKYMHSEGFKRNLHLYGEHRKEQGRCYVVEGHIDVLILWQMGYRPVVALLGSNPGDAQIEKLVAYYPGLILVTDGDEAGESMANLVKHGIADRIPVGVRQTQPGKDPGDLTPEVALELLGPPPFKGVDKA
jgi:hypothetical protein